MTSPRQHTMASSSPRQHDNDPLPSREKSLKRKPLERLLLFDENLTFSSIPRSSSFTDFLPPITESTEPPTPPESPAENGFALQNTKTEDRLPKHRHQPFSIPKIVIECVENAIIVNPDEEKLANNKLYYLNKTRQPRNDNNDRWAFPTIIKTRQELEYQNVRVLSLKGENRLEDLSSLQAEFLPNLNPKRYRDSHNVVDASVGVSGNVEAEIRQKQKMVQEFLKYTPEAEHKTPPRGHLERVSQLGGMFVDGGNCGKKEIRIQRQKVVNDSGSNMWYSREAHGQERLRKKPRGPTSYTSRSRQHESSTHDRLTHYFNNIAKAFQETPTRDSFSPLSGNMTSDLRNHISRMSQSTNHTNVYARARGDHRDTFLPNMHMYDVMTSKVKHDRQRMERNSPVPIAEGVDFTTLVPMTSEDKSTTRGNEKDILATQELKNESLTLSEMEDDEGNTHIEIVPLSASHVKVHQWFDKTDRNIRRNTHKLETSGEISDGFEHFDPGSSSMAAGDHENNKQRHDGMNRPEQNGSCDGDVGNISWDHNQNCNTDDVEFNSHHNSSHNKPEVTLEAGDLFQSKDDTPLIASGPSAKNEVTSGQVQNTRGELEVSLTNDEDILMTPPQRSLELDEKLNSIPRRPRKPISSMIKPARNSVVKNTAPVSSKINSPARVSIPINSSQKERIGFDRSIPNIVGNNSRSQIVVSSKIDTGLSRNRSVFQQQVNNGTTEQNKLKSRPQRSQNQKVDLSGSRSEGGINKNFVGHQNNQRKDKENATSFELSEKSEAYCPSNKSDKSEILAKERNSILEDEVSEEEEEEAEQQFMKRIKARVLRMRQELPPPSPTKLCFVLTNATPSHGEILDQIEAGGRKVKVTNLQYDPIYITRCGQCGYKSMWIFEITPDSDRNRLLTSNLKVFNQSVSVRPLDDVYAEEHRTYQMYHAVQREQMSKKLTGKRKKRKL